MKLVHVATLFLAISALVGCASTSSAPYSMNPYHDGNQPPESIRVPQSVGESRGDADYHFTLGESYSLEGLSDKAIEEFKLTLVHDPDSSRVRMRLGAEYLKKGQVTESLEQVESAVEKDPKYTDARLLLAGLYGSLRMYDKAESQYREILKNEPENTEAPVSLAVLFAEQKRYDESIRIFEKLALNKNYENPHHAWYFIGRIQLEKENYADADVAFKKSLASKPQFEDAAISLSKSLESQKKKKDAIKLLEDFQDKKGPSAKVAEVLSRHYLEAKEDEKAYRQFEIVEEADHDNLNVKVKMALVLIERKDFEKAATKLKQILVLAPESDKIRFYLAAVYEEMKDYDEAISHFNMIPASSSFYPEAMVHVSYLHKTQGRTAEAIATIERAIEKQDDVEQFYSLYASLLHDSRDYAKAEKMLLQAVEKFPKSEQLFFFLGSVQDSMGEKRKTLESMRRVTELNPDHAQALNYLAYTKAELGENLDEAEVLARRALQLRPQDAYIMDTVGWVLFKKGQYEDSIKVLEKAHKAKPDEAIIAEHLGDAYYRVQLTGKARAMYQRASELERDEKNIEKIRAKITAIDQRYVPSKGSSRRVPASNPSER